MDRDLISRLYPILFVLAIILALLPPALAEDAAASCPGVDVQSIKASFVRPPFSGTAPATQISVIPSDARMRDRSSDIKIIVTGPMLGEMDSRDIKTKISCTSDGFE